MKLGFFKRLATNEYTHSLLKELFQNSYRGCFNHEINELLGIGIDSTLEDALLSSDIKLVEINRTKKEIKDVSKMGERVKRIKELVESNSIKAREELFEITKYEPGV